MEDHEVPTDVFPASGPRNEVWESPFPQRSLLMPEDYWPADESNEDEVADARAALDDPPVAAPFAGDVDLTEALPDADPRLTLPAPFLTDGEEPDALGHDHISDAAIFASNPAGAEPSAVLPPSPPAAAPVSDLAEPRARRRSATLVSLGSIAAVAALAFFLTLGTGSDSGTAPQRQLRAADVPSQVPVTSPPTTRPPSTVAPLPASAPAPAEPGPPLSEDPGTSVRTPTPAPGNGAPASQPQTAARPAAAPVQSTASPAPRAASAPAAAEPAQAPPAPAAPAPAAPAPAAPAPEPAAQVSEVTSSPTASGEVQMPAAAPAPRPAPRPAPPPEATTPTTPTFTIETPTVPTRPANPALAACQTVPLPACE